MRINKFIADSGITSRRKAEELITQGRVSVNNNTVLELSYRINPAKDDVLVDGEKIKIKKSKYYLLNKPKGVISTTNDERKRRTVIDLIKSKEKIFPVGRLDYNTTGVLLITNDGNFSNLLTHPGNKVPKVYEVLLDKQLEINHKRELLKGVFIDKRKGNFKNINFVDARDRKRVEVSCIEGRNHFVKRMFEKFGYRIKSLNRISFAGIEVDIPVGTYRELSTDEVSKLISMFSKNN